MPAQREKTLPNGRLTRSWTTQDPVDVLRVNVEPPDELLKHFDRHGRSLTTYALLQTAETARHVYPTPNGRMPGARSPCTRHLPGRTGDVADG